MPKNDTIKNSSTLNLNNYSAKLTLLDICLGNISSSFYILRYEISSSTYRHFNNRHLLKVLNLSKKYCTL